MEERLPGGTARCVGNSLLLKIEQGGVAGACEFRILAGVS